MTAGVQIGIALALVCALMTNLAALLKHRGACDTVAVSLRHPLASARALAASRWFAAGMGVAALAWLAHIAALALAPISLVQAVFAGGAVAVGVMAHAIFGHRVGRRQWIGLAVGAVGLVLLVVTIPRLEGAHSSFSMSAMLAFEGGLVAIAAGFWWTHRSGYLRGHGGALLAAIAGTLFALAGIAIKGLTGIETASAAVLSPWLLTVIAAGVFAQFAAVAALQRGEAVAVIGLMGLVANAAQIAGGVLVFGDPLSASPAGVVLQGLAFCMVCGSAFLMPAPDAREPAEAVA